MTSLSSFKLREARVTHKKHAFSCYISKLKRRARRVSKIIKENRGLR